LNTSSLFAKDIKVLQSLISCFNNISCATNY